MTLYGADRNNRLRLFLLLAQYVPYIIISVDNSLMGVGAERDEERGDERCSERNTN